MHARLIGDGSDLNTKAKFPLDCYVGIINTVTFVRYMFASANVDKLIRKHEIEEFKVNSINENLVLCSSRLTNLIVEESDPVTKVARVFGKIKD